MNVNVKELLPHIFARPIAFHRVLAEVSGSVNGGVFLSQAMYWSEVKEKADGWFYKTAEDWERETFLSRREQETVRRNLVKKGVLEEVKKGIPAKLYFRVNNSVLLGLIEKVVQTRMAESAKQASTNPPSSDGGKGEPITENTTEITSETTSDINNISPGPDFEAEFSEFWAAYPKRPGNSKKDAIKSYVKARQKLKVPKEIILAGTKAYAAFREGEPPLFTKTAAAWLNAEMWACDWTRDTSASATKAAKPEAPEASDADLDKLAAAYSGRIGERNAAKKLLAAEMAKGTTLDALCEAARKYSLFCKGPPYEDRRTTPAMLETWLRFKWREMDAYEFCKVGPDQIRTVRPKKATR